MWKTILPRLYLDIGYSQNIHRFSLAFLVEIYYHIIGSSFYEKRGLIL